MKVNKKGILILMFFVAIIPVIYKEIKNKELEIIKEETFEKDEYCRKTYNKSFVENYEKKLLGRDGIEREYMELVDIFYSPKNNECFAVYDYNYINFPEEPILDSNGKRIDLNIFQKRIAKAINANEIINTFEITMSGNFKDGEKERYDNAIGDLKSKN